MKRSRDSFTLIEMLVVISVIAILAGLSFKLVQISKRNADRAATIAKLEKVAHALNEFRAEYGTYPPVAPKACSIGAHGADCRVCYQYENTNNQSSFAFGKLNSQPNLANLFDMGLVSYLEYRDPKSISHTENSEWIADTDRDELAKARWSVFIEGVIQSGGPVSNELGGASDETWFENSFRTITDSWGEIIKYESDPPYLTYKLWSKGPDKADGTVDDIHKDKWDN